MDQEFYSPEQIGKMLGISTYTVQELCRSGKMHHTRWGRRIRIKREWAEKFMMASARNPMG